MNTTLSSGKFFCETNHVFWADVGGETVFRLLANRGHHGNLALLVSCTCYLSLLYIKIELDERVLGNKIVKLHVSHHSMVLYNFISYRLFPPLFCNVSLNYSQSIYLSIIQFK